MVVVSFEPKTFWFHALCSSSSFVFESASELASLPYFAVWAGIRYDISRFIAMPRWPHNKRTWSLARRTSSLEEAKNEPIVQVSQHANLQTMKHGRHRSHDPRKHLRSCGKTKTKSTELINMSIRHEAKKSVAVRMHRDLKICIFKVDGDHPVKLSNGLKNWLGCLHLEASLLDEHI